MSSDTLEFSVFHAGIISIKMFMAVAKSSRYLSVLRAKCLMKA
jgi:hypothetical protein